MTTSAELFARAVEAMPGGNTRSTLYIPPVPPYARRGTGCRLVDEDGHETFDLQANYTTLVHGHRHPVVMAAAMAALRGRHVLRPALAATTWRWRSASRSACPWSSALRFTNSGSEAVMMAFRTARALTGKDGILRFEGSYHGIYDAALPAGAGRHPRRRLRRPVRHAGRRRGRVPAGAGRARRPPGLRDHRPDAEPRRPEAGAAGLRRPRPGRDDAPRDPADRRRGRSPCGSACPASTAATASRPTW